MKNIIIWAIFFILVNTPFITMNISAEDLIRYASEYSIIQGSVTEVPDNETLKEWFNIDLPLNEDGSNKYTVEFDTTDVNFNEIGDYKIKMTFYKDIEHKYEKIFVLSITEPIELDTVENINAKYFEDVLKNTIIAVLIIILITILFSNTETIRIAVVKNNNFLKIITTKEKDDYFSNIAKIMRKLKLDTIESATIIAKKDLNNIQLKQVKTKKKFDYVLFIK